MNPESIYHRPRNEFAYFDEHGTVTLLLRAASNSLHSATLCWFDKYIENQPHTHTDMECILTDNLFAYFRVQVKPPYRRLQYYFRLVDTSGEVWYLDEQGVHQTQEGCTEACFQMPYLNRSDAIRVPEWAKSAVFYQIFPDSFARHEPLPTEEVFPAWGSEPDIIKPIGGNFAGIREHLDHLSALGINALYLCPIFQSNTCHRYNTYDYFSIDPRLGTLEDFRAFLDDCHNRGIRVVLDAVFNHTCDTFPKFRDVMALGPDSEYYNWYFINNYPFEVDGEYSYERFAFERHMPKLNTENPNVRDYLLRVARYWTEMGNDGWRLDVANEIDLSFWRAFRTEVKKINPEALILGEVWGDAQPYLAGDMFDTVMNYPFASLCRACFLDKTMDSDNFRQEINRILTHYPAPMTYCMYNLLGSHDTARWLSLAKEAFDPTALSAVFQFLFVGMPAIYYGDETGMTGADFIQARRCMCFTPLTDTGKRLLHLYTALVALREKHPALTKGDFRWLEPVCVEGSKALAFRRSYQEDELTLIWNSGEQPLRCRLTWDNDAEKTVSLAPMEYQIFIKNQEVIL